MLKRLLAAAALAAIAMTPATVDYALAQYGHPYGALYSPMPIRYKDLSSDFVYSRGGIFWPVAPVVRVQQ